MTVTAQQSRFHFETVHEGDAKEVGISYHLIVSCVDITGGPRPRSKHLDGQSRDLKPRGLALGNRTSLRLDGT